MVVGSDLIDVAKKCMKPRKYKTAPTKYPNNGLSKSWFWENTNNRTPTTTSTIISIKLNHFINFDSVVLITKLPVYSNTAFDDKGVPCALNEKQLEERVGIAARESGTTVTDVIKSYASELYPDYEKDFVYAISAETADGSIVANAAGGLTVSFNNPVSLPFEFVNGNRDHAEKAIRYFSDRFSGLISGFVDFEEPAFAVSYKYDVYGEINGEYIAYNSADDRVGDILNYNLQYA